MGTASADKTQLNVTTGTVLKAITGKPGVSSGKLFTITVLVAGAPGTASDIDTTGGVAAANLIFNIPAVVGVYNFEGGFPFYNGLVIVPGASQVISVAFS